MAKAMPTADELRPIKEQAVNFIRFAREQNATSLIADVKVDEGPTIRFIVERSEQTVPTGVDDTVTETGDMDEHITVKRGRSSGQQVLFAGPAAWLEA